MPPPSRITLYPNQWFELIRQVAVNGKTLQWRRISDHPLSKAQATQLRFKFYALRSLLRKDPSQGDLAQLSESVEVRLFEVADGWIVSFSPRDANAEARGLEDALKEIS